MEKGKFWSRMGQWFQGTGRQGLDPDLGSEATSQDRLQDGPDGRRAAKPRRTNDGSGTRVWLRLGGASARADRLEQFHTRLVELAESIRTHVERQAGQSEAAAISLNRLADKIMQLCEESQSRRAMLERIVSGINEQAASTKRIEQSLSQLPQLAEGQRTTMVSLAQHLDLSRQTNEKGAATLDQFQRTLVALGEGINASAGALNDLRADTIDRQERLAAVVHQHARRMTWFAAAAIALLTATAASSWIALLR